MENGVFASTRAAITSPQLARERAALAADFLDAKVQLHILLKARFNLRSALKQFLHDDAFIFDWPVFYIQPSDKVSPAMSGVIGEWSTESY